MRANRLRTQIWKSVEEKKKYTHKSKVEWGNIQRDLKVTEISKENILLAQKEEVGETFWPWRMGGYGGLEMVTNS